mgnify:CR=1 FL=1
MLCASTPSPARARLRRMPGVLKRNSCPSTTKRAWLPATCDSWATGAATGIHDVVAGQHARVMFDGIAEIVIAMRQARPEEGA